MEQVTLTIDGIEVRAEAGATVLQAALDNGIYIPHLCYYPDLEPVGVCRLCMVEIEGRGLTISCKTPVSEAMVVTTDNAKINKIRRVAVELLIINHQVDCLACGKNTHCKLQDVSNHLNIERARLNRLRRSSEPVELDTSNPFFDRNPNKCVLCGVCVRTCEQIQGARAIDFARRGFDTTISTFADGPLVESNCESCGECVVRCPTGALIAKKFQPPVRQVKTVCPYCGCGCGIYLGVRGNTIVSATGDVENAVSRGRLCVKGRFGYNFVNHRDRLTSPLIRRDGKLVEATWDEALDLIAEKLGKYKGDQFAAIASGKCTNEDNYVIQKFARAVMGTNNIDHCARLCHAPSVAGLAQSFGSGAMTNSVAEIGDAACIFAIGTNTTSAHPIIGLEIRGAVRKGAKLIVANPREIDLVRDAEIFMQHNPGSDVALMMGMMRVILDENLHDPDFIAERTEGFEAFKESLANFDLDTVEKITGVERDTIVAAARLYATTSPASILYAMGITQHTHGTDNVLATSNLALLTGNVGKPSTGVNPLRGQNNVQGACDMGALPNVYPGYQKVHIAEINKKFSSAWGCELSDSPGLTHMELFDAAYDGKIKAMYLVGENPVLSEANSSHVEAAIKKLEFFVAQDIFLTETSELADVVLPAVTFAEKDGTFTNTERGVLMVRKAIEPVGQSRSDWLITCQIARRMGAKGFDFANPSQVMDEVASVTPSYGGMSYERLEVKPLQWPCPTSEHTGTLFLHGERFATPNGKGQFKPLEYRPPAEVVDDEYPMVLTTERSLYHFHTATMTRRVEGLSVMRKEELVEMNPVDAAAMGIEDGEEVRVISRRGKVTATAKVTEVSPPGVISMTFHFSESPTNVMTSPALDPLAKIPETKVCAVRIEKLK